MTKDFPSDASEFELALQRALDHLQSAIWHINDMTSAAPFAERLRYTQLAGELSRLSRELGEILALRREREHRECSPPGACTG